MLLGGRLSDVFGRRGILNLSLLLFGIGSLFAGIATSATILIFSRFIQGVGASILAPTSLALIMDYFTGEERIKAIASPKELIIAMHEPLTGAHVGPGMLSLFFFGDGR